MFFVKEILKQVQDDSVIYCTFIRKQRIQTYGACYKGHLLAAVILNLFQDLKNLLFRLSVMRNRKYTPHTFIRGT